MLKGTLSNVVDCIQTLLFDAVDKYGDYTARNIQCFVFTTFSRLEKNVSANELFFEH